MRIIVDLDSTIVDLLNPWLAAYNADHDDTLTIDQLTRFDLHALAKGGKAIYSYLDQPGFFENLPALEGAVEAVKFLHDDGHELVFATSCPHPEGKKGKGIWFQKNLPFIHPGKLAILDDKHFIAADALVDDGAHNIKAYKAAHPRAFATGIAHPYNEGCAEFDLRAESWRSPKVAWEAMVEGLLQHARKPADFWSEVFTPPTECSKHKAKLIPVFGHLTCPVCRPWVRRPEEA